MRAIDFCIVGAPKCGTTALYGYLRQHPRVYIPDIKEPHFFCDDFPGYRRVTTTAEYEALFDRAANSQKLGEASVFYLYSSTAVKNLLEYSPSTKLIVMLRNPIDMAHSLHSQLCYSLREDVTDFEAAWHLQEQRAQGKKLPSGCLAPEHLQYRAVCSLGNQLDRLLRIAPQSQVRTLFFDDFIGNPSAVYHEVLSFLGLESHDADFSRANANKVHRSRRLAQFLMHPPFPFNVVKRLVRKAAGRHRHTLSRTIYRTASMETTRPQLSDSFERLLVEEFRADVTLLADITGRSLGHWLTRRATTVEAAG